MNDFMLTCHQRPTIQTTFTQSQYVNRKKNSTRTALSRGQDRVSLVHRPRLYNNHNIRFNIITYYIVFTVDSVLKISVSDRHDIIVPQSNAL